MNRQLAWGMAGVLALCAASVGCAQSGQTVRGQSPTPVEVVTPAPVEWTYGPIIGSAPGYGEHKKHPKKHDFKTYPYLHGHNFGYDGGYYAGPEGYYTTHKAKAYTVGGAAGGCPHCQYGSACPPDGCPHCGCDHGCPKHHQSYQYKWPDNLVYPQGPVPAAMVQWPYYTLRGPTDFFMP